MFKSNLVYLLFPVILLSGCPSEVNIQPSPPPSSVVPTPIITASPITNSYDLISGNLFRVEFGPGTKGVSNLGPGSKGVNALGPGTKGVSNLKFNLNFDNNLIRQDIQSFKTLSDQPLYVNNILLSLEKDGNKIADINVLPKTSNVDFAIDTNIVPGLYELRAKVSNNFEPLEVISKVELKSDFEIKVVLYAKTMDRKDLDISIRTKSLEWFLISRMSESEFTGLTEFREFLRYS